MGYWKWLYKAIRDTDMDKLKEIWWFVRTIGGLIFILILFMLIFFTLIDNELIAMILVMIFGVFFGVSWFVYNIERD